MDITIRKAGINDVDGIMSVERTGISHPWDKASIEATVKDDNKVCVVACAGEKITGYIYASFVLDEAEIGNICVLPELRGQGVGRKLMEELLNILKSVEVTRIFLEVESDNEGAIALYEKCGFVRYNERKDYYGKGRDALLYSCQI